MNVLYSYIKYSYIHTYTCSCRIHTDAMNNRRVKILYKYMYLSLYCKGSKRLCVVSLWEGAGDRTELKYFDPHSYGRQRCVFLVLLMLNQTPRGPFCWVMAFFTASYQHLLLTPIHQGPKPLRPGVAFPTTSHSNWNSKCHLTSVLTMLYNSSTPTRSPTRSLEWHDWSSSSGNNCHAVHRSLSSGASVYECIMGFTLSHLLSQIHPRDLFRLLAIGMCHFVMACLLGPKVKIQQMNVLCLVFGWTFWIIFKICSFFGTSVDKVFFIWLLFLYVLSL